MISRHYFSIYPVLSRIMQGIYFSSSRQHDQESNTDNKHKRTNKNFTKKSSLSFSYTLDVISIISSQQNKDFWYYSFDEGHSNCQNLGWVGYSPSSIPYLQLLFIWSFLQTGWIQMTKIYKRLDKPTRENTANFLQPL